MSVLTVLLVIIVVGVLLWLVNTQVTIMDATVKRILNAVVIIVLVVWLLKVFGVWGYLTSLTV